MGTQILYPCYLNQFRYYRLFEIKYSKHFHCNVHCNAGNTPLHLACMLGHKGKSTYFCIIVTRYNCSQAHAYQVLNL
jgi:hypothetical protein